MFALLTREYGFTPDEIFEMTLFQFRAYLSQIAEVEKLLSPWGSGEEEEEPGVQDSRKEFMENLIEKAELFGIEPPEEW